MNKLAAMLLLTGLAVGCLPTKPTNPAGEAKKSENKAAEESIAARMPPVTPESLNQYNAAQKAQALEDELKRDGQKQPKVVVEARK